MDRRRPSSTICAAVKVTIYDGQYSFRHADTNNSFRAKSAVDFSMTFHGKLAGFEKKIHLRQNELATKGIQHGGHKMSAESRTWKNVRKSISPSKILPVSKA